MTKQPQRKSPKMTPRQKNLVRLMPQVEAGSISLEEAMKRAGYAESTARQQTETMRNLRQSSAMQKALRKANVTEDVLAETIGEGIEKKDGYRFHYVKLAAELLDAFPATKNINATVPIEDLIRQQEGSDAEERDR